LDFNTASGLVVNAANITVNNTVTTTANGVVTLNPGTLLTIAAAGDMNLDGAFSQGGAGTVSTAGDITTTADNIGFTTAVTLTGPVGLTSADGTISFGATLKASGAAIDLGLSAGTGTVTFSNSVGNSVPPRDLTVTSAGMVSFGVGATVFNFSRNVDLTTDDLDILRPLHVTGTLGIYQRTPTNPITLGTAAGGLHLSNTDLGFIQTAATITIGQTTVQVGAITATNALFYYPVASLTAVNLNSDSGAGAIVLSDAASTALDLNGNTSAVLTLSSGSGGISALNNVGTNASIANAGSTQYTLLKTNSATPSLGTVTTNGRIVFAAGSGAVRILATAGTGTVALRGLGSLTIDGGAASVTGNRLLNIDTTGALSDLTFNQQIDVGSGDLALAPVRNLVLNFIGTSGTPSILSSGSNWNLFSALLLGNNSYFSQGTAAGKLVRFFGTLDGTYSLTIDAGSGSAGSVQFDAAVGATLAPTDLSVLNAVTITNNAATWRISGTLTLRTSTGVDSTTDWTVTSGSTDLGTVGVWDLGSTHTLRFQTYDPTSAMNVGFSGVGWSLDANGVGRLNNSTSHFSKIVFGNAGTQSGSVTFRTVNLSAANGGFGVAVDVWADSGSGAVVFDDAGSSFALNLGTHALGVRANTSITSAQTENSYAELNTTGAIDLDAVGNSIGTSATQPLQVEYHSTTVVNLQKIPPVGTTAPGGVWIQGVGGYLTLGEVRSTGNVAADVWTGGKIYLTQNVTTSSLTYNRPTLLRPASGSSITLSTSGGTVTFASTLDEDDAGGVSAGTNSLTINAGAGDIRFQGAIGTKAFKDLTLTGKDITLDSGLKTATGATFSATHSGVLKLSDATSTADTGSIDITLAGPFTESGGTVQIAADVSTAAANLPLVFTSPVTLIGNVLLTTGTGAVTFSSTVAGDGATTDRDLTINASGVTTLSGAVGTSPNPLTGLTTDSGGSTVVDGGLVRTTGGQVYNDTVTVGADVAFTSTSTGAITFAQTLNGAFNVGVNTAGTTTFTGTVGNSGALASLTTDVGGTTDINGGSVKTTGAQTYNDAVLAGSSLTLKTTNAAIGFVASYNGQANDLAFDPTVGTGAITFTGAVTNLGTASGTSLTVPSGQTGLVRFMNTVSGVSGWSFADGTSLQMDQDVTLSGGDTANTLLGNVTFDGLTFTSSQPMNLGNAPATDVVTISGSPVVIDTSAASQAVNLQAKVNGPQALVINAGSATTTFAGTVGLPTALASLTTDAGGTTALNGGTVTTSGAQTYHDAVTLGADLVLTGGSLTLDSTTSGPNLTLNSSGATTFLGAATLTSVTTDGAGTTNLNGGSVTTTGAQTYNDAVSIDTNDLTLTASAVTFASTVQSKTATAKALTVNSVGTGATVFGQAVGGGGLPLSSLTTNADGTIVLGGAVTTTGTQTYADTVTYSASGVTLTGNVTFLGTLKGNAAGSQDLVFQTGASATTVTFGTFDNNGAYTALRNRLVFAGTLDTNLITAGQTFGDLVFSKTGATVTLTGQTVIAHGDVTVSSGTVSLSDTLATLDGTGKTLAIASGASFLFASTAAFNPGAPAFPGLALGDGTVVDNAGTFTAWEPSGVSQVFLRGTGAGRAVLRNSNATAGTFLFPAANAPDLALSHVTVVPGTATHVVNVVNPASVLFLDDDTVQVFHLTNLGTVNFGGLSATADAHDLEVFGDFDNTSGTVTGQATTTAAASSRITFSNTIPVVLKTGGTGTGKNLYHLAVNGTSSVTVTDANLGLSGNLDQGAAATLDLTGRILTVRGSVALLPTTPAQTVLTNTALILAPVANTTVSLATTAGIVLPPTVWAGATGTPANAVLNQTSTISFQSFWAFGGTWNTNAFNVSTVQDFVALGVGYVAYTIGGVTYHPADDGELAKTRLPAYYQNKLNYPYWGTRLGVLNTALTAAFGANLLTDGRPTPGTMTSAFTVGTGQTVAVGRNFYNYGAPMTGAGVWNLTLVPKWTTVQLNAALTTDWFGAPFAVALATGPGMAITNSQASQPVAAALTAVAGTTTPGTATAAPLWTSAVTLTSSPGWDNTQPDFDTRTATLPRTRFDDLVEIPFTKVMRNVAGESARVVDPASTSTTTDPRLDLLRFDQGKVYATTIHDFFAGVPGTTGAFGVGEYTTRAAVNADKSVLTFRASGGATWNTDATGSSAGAAASTDRSGVHQTRIPDLTLEKGRLYDLSGNPIVNHDGVNFNGAAVSSVFTGTADGARPVLYKVQTGQAAKHFPNPTIPQDGHNYWKLTWSEAVALDPGTGSSFVNLDATTGTVGTPPGAATATAANKAATLTFGDSYTDDVGLAGQVQLPGLFRYPGTLYRSTRTANDLTPQSSQVAANKTSNSLSRSSVHDLYVYLTGASSGSGLTQYWDGFWWGATEPNGQAFTVSSAYAVQVLDSAGNPVENENVDWVPPSLTQDPKKAYTITALDSTLKTITQTWELDRPVFAPYNATIASPNTFEVLPTGKLDVVTEVQFHTLANQILSGQLWNSDTGHPDNATTTHFGIRDSSRVNFYRGLQLSSDDKTFVAAGKAPAAGLSYNADTAVDNDLFNGGPLPKFTGFAVNDDGYFTLELDAAKVLPAWKPSASFTVKYDPFAGQATNLAGRLLEPPVLGASFRALDRTLPTIALTLTGKDMKRIYVQFSRKVQVNVADPKDALKLIGSTNSIVSMDYIDNTTGGFQQAFLNLASPFQASELLTARIQVGSIGSVGSGFNYLDPNITYSVTTIGLNFVQPVWASDGPGGEVNEAGTDHVVHDFTGGEYLTARDVELQAKIFGGTTVNKLPLRLYYDFKVPTSLIVNGLWLPTGLYSFIADVVPTKDNTEARHLDPSKANTAGDLRNFILPGNDSEMENGSAVQFFFQLGALYMVRSVDPTDPRQMAPWQIPFKGIKTQKNGVTILHNVIDPTQGQKVQILYTMKRSGVVTAEVFALDGSAVKVLHRGRQASGDYSLYWDGKNESGAVVARGVYFVRVVAPDIDETRNVMVIK